MIGRAAIYAPWLFAQVKHYLETGEHLAEPDLEERTRLCIRHLVTGVEYKGERRGVLDHRKYYAGYLRNARNIAKLRAELMQYVEVGPIVERLERFLANMDEVGEVDAASNLGI
jgi:tRNA-dihydrouridine synthase B